ncbi:MAG: VWA domain-containing protein [Akkermansiaceae bacterium]|nr:VWA domain-containing protein [Akkermansiaceae bacterium]
MEFLALKNLFWVLPVVILSLGIAAWSYHQRKKAISLLTQNSGHCNLKSNASPVRRRILGIVLLTSLLLAGVSVLRPISGFVRTEFKRPSKNLVVLFDISNSMTATDTEGISRNDAAKLLLREFINSRPTDRIGLISFAGDTFIETPVTRSRATLLKRVNQIQPGDFLVPGTDITAALEEAQNLLTEEPPPGSAIIVLSDGDNVTGGDPETVLRQLKKSKVPIIAVAFGKDGVPANVPRTEMFTQSNHNTVKQLSGSTNGLFLSASPKEVEAQITQLNTRVDTIELNGENIAGELYERPQDIFVWPLTLSLICLMIHILLPLRTKNWHPLTTAIAFLLSIAPSLPGEEVDSYDEALEVAKEEALPVMVIFTGSDWSKLSITFEQEILTHQIFKQWAETKIVWTLIDLPRVGLTDVERRARRTLMKELGVETFPMAVFLDVNKNPMGSLTHDPKGPSSWIERANAILKGEIAAADTAASTDYLPEEIRKSLEDPTLTETQRSIRFYNKALELEKAEPELTLKSEDRFKLLLDLYSKAADAAPILRNDLKFAALHKRGILHHRKGQSRVPKSEQEIMMMAMQERSDPVKLLKRAKSSFKNALEIYRSAAPLKPADEELSDNLALVYKNISRVQAYLDFLAAFQAAIEDTQNALNQENRFVKSLEREVNTLTEVNKKAIESAANSIQHLIARAEAIEDSPTILPEEGLKDYRLAEEDIVLAPSPHRERQLEQAAQHIQDALDHLIDPQQQQQPQPAQGEGEGEPQEGEKSEGEEPEGEGGRQNEQENPQGDRPEGDEPTDGDEGEGDEKGKGEPDDNDLKRAEKEGGDLRSRLLRKQQQEYLRNGRRVPRSKNH